MSLVDSVINLSTSDITVEQIRVLGFGLSFAQKPAAPNIVKSLANLHRYENKVSDAQVLKGALIPGFLELLQAEETFPRRY